MSHAASSCDAIVMNMSFRAGKVPGVDGFGDFKAWWSMVCRSLGLGFRVYVLLNYSFLAGKKGTCFIGIPFPYSLLMLTTSKLSVLGLILFEQAVLLTLGSVCANTRRTWADAKRSYCKEMTLFPSTASFI